MVSMIHQQHRRTARHPKGNGGDDFLGVHVQDDYVGLLPGVLAQFGSSLEQGLRSIQNTAFTARALYRFDQIVRCPAPLLDQHQVMDHFTIKLHPTPAKVRVTQCPVSLRHYMQPTGPAVAFPLALGPLQGLSRVEQ
jgi:hypothetical protein